MTYLIAALQNVEESIGQAAQSLLGASPQIQLVLVTRQDPPLPLPRLRVRRQVVEICEEDLRFTADGAGDFLNQALGLDLDPQTRPSRSVPGQEPGPARDG